MLNLASGFYLFLARAAAVIIQLRMVERWFGPHDSGLNVLLNQVTYYVMLAELGLSAATLSLLFEPLHHGDYPHALALLKALRRVLNRVVLITAPVCVALLVLYALHLRTQIPYREGFPALLFAAAGSFVTLLTLPQQSYLNAQNRLFEVNFTLGTGFFVKTFLGLTAAWLLHNYLALVLAFPLVSLAEMAVLRFRCRRLTPQVQPRDVPGAEAEIRAKARFVLAHRLGGLIYYQSDFIILSLVASLALVGAYAEYQYLAAGLVGLITACSNALTTQVARRQMSTQPAERAQLYARTSRVALFAATACALVFLSTAQYLVRLLFGSAPLLGMAPTLIGILLLLNLAKAGDDVWVNARGAFETGFTFPLYESALYITLGVVLARRFGVDGILIAGITTNLIFSVGMRLYVLAKAVLHTTVARVARRRAGAAASAAVLAIPLAFLPLILHPSRNQGLAALLAVASLYVCGILYRLCKDLRLLPPADLSLTGPPR